jgi:glycosyltransferase involved in cell wall biosynthesis
MTASVVIATRNRRALIQRLLTCLAAQDCGAQSYEVIVVDDGSTDGTTDWLKTQTATSIAVVTQGARGQVEAINAGVLASSGDIVLFLDDDVTCDKSLIRLHLEAHERVATAAVFGPTLLAGDSAPGVATEFRRHCAQGLFNQPKQACEKSFHSLGCANTSVRRSVLRAHQPLDPAFPRANDLELGLYARARGVHFVFIPEAVVYETYGKTSGRVLKDDVPLEGAAAVRLVRAYPQFKAGSALNRLFQRSAIARTLTTLAMPFLSVLDPLMNVLCRTAFQCGSVGTVIALRLFGLRMALAFFHGAICEAGSVRNLHALLRETCGAGEFVSKAARS